MIWQWLGAEPWHHAVAEEVLAGLPGACRMVQIQLGSLDFLPHFSSKAPKTRPWESRPSFLQSPAHACLGFWESDQAGNAPALQMCSVHLAAGPHRPGARRGLASPLQLAWGSSLVKPGSSANPLGTTLGQHRGQERHL